MSWDNNPINQPENFGLETFGYLDDPHLDYEFDTIVVLRDPKTRQFFWAQDAGCSCPTPFEDFDGRQDLTEITDESWGEFIAAVDALGQYWEQPDESFEAEKVSLLGKLALERHHVA